MVCSLQGVASDSLSCIKISNAKVYFEKVYNLEGLSKDEVDSVLHSFIPGIASISQYSENKNSITARFEKAEMPLRKYGLRGFTSSYLIQSPFNANISIESKDGKYKVIVSGIYFDSGNSLTIGGVSGKIDGTFEDIAYLKGKSRLVTPTNEQRFREAKAFERYLSDTFEYKSPAETKSDW